MVIGRGTHQARLSDLACCAGLRCGFVNFVGVLAPKWNKNGKGVQLSGALLQNGPCAAAPSPLASDEPRNPFV